MNYLAMIPKVKCTDKAQILPKHRSKEFTRILAAALLVCLIASCASTPDKKAEQDEGYVVQAVQYMHAGRLDAALASVKKAIELNPEAWQAWRGPLS